MLKNGFYKIVPAPIGYVWRALPLGTEKIEYNKETYYFYGGVFLQEKNNVYVTVKAPEGAIIIKMPQGARPVTMHGATFYIYGNDYYLPVFLDDKPAYEVAKDPKLVF